MTNKILVTIYNQTVNSSLAAYLKQYTRSKDVPNYLLQHLFIVYMLSCLRHGGNPCTDNQRYGLLDTSIQ